MVINSLNVYSILSMTGNENSNKMEEVLAQLKALQDLQSEKEVKEWLSKKYTYNGSSNSLVLCPNVTLKFYSGKKFFNVTVTKDKEVNSYNYAR